MTRQKLLLLHPLFIASILVLLFNDFYLKWEYGNQITGKLSDFAGLFAFGVFAAAIFSRYKTWVLVACGLFFIWWKSPLADPIILFCNSCLGIPVDRTIDNSDYIALAVLPGAYFLKPIHFPTNFIRTATLWIVGTVAMFSFTATSMIKNLTDSNRVQVDKTIKTKKSDSTVIALMEKGGLNPVQIPAIYEREWSPNLYVKTNGKVGGSVMVPIDSVYTGLYRKIDYGNCYNIPVMYLNGDSIFNLQFIVSGFGTSRKRIWFHSFEYRIPLSTETGNPAAIPLAYQSHSLSKKFGKLIKKRIKEILKDK